MHGRGGEQKAGPVWGNEWVRKGGHRAMQSKSPHRLVRLYTLYTFRNNYPKLIPIATLRPTPPTPYVECWRVLECHVCPHALLTPR